MSPILTCCTPEPSFRSEWAWNHAPTCPENPNVPITDHVPTTAIEALKEHPAFPDTLMASALAAWNSHPSLCLCASCAYVSHWLDRDDDRLPEEMDDGTIIDLFP